MDAVDDPIREPMVAAAVATNGTGNGAGNGTGNGSGTGSVNGTARKRRRRPVLLLVLLVVVLVGGTFAVLSAIHASQYQSTDDAYIDGRIINISPQVSARVLSIPADVDDNRPVHKDQILAVLDDRDYRVALSQATATKVAMDGKLQQAASEINEAMASRDQAAAEVEVAEANSVNAIADYNRFVELSKANKGAVSRQQMDSAIAAKQSSEAQVKQAKAKLASAIAVIATKEATKIAAEGDVQKAAADVDKANVNLSYCVIKAPEDGKITKKNVEPGSYVQAGEQLLAIVPSEVWVVANFKETQLEKMRVGQPVTISVDAYPNKQLHGKVDSIQSGTGSRFSMLPAENATGNFVKVVQRVPVKIILTGESNSDAGQLLTPGMSVLPEVDVR